MSYKAVEINHLNNWKWFTVKFEHIQEEQYTLEIPNIKMDKVYLPVHIKKTYKYVACKCTFKVYSDYPKYTNPEQVFVTYAHCSKKDQYSKKIGRELSFDRAIKEAKLDESPLIESFLRCSWNLPPTNI